MSTSLSTVARSAITLLQQQTAELDSPIRLLYGAVMVLLIVYTPLLPVALRTFADTLLGRVFGVVILYGVVETLGWVYGLLTAMAFLVILRATSRASPFAMTEGFDGGGSVTEKQSLGRRWFVEKVLGEHPVKIATDKVPVHSYDYS